MVNKNVQDIYNIVHNKKVTKVYLVPIGHVLMIVNKTITLNVLLFFFDLSG